VLNGFSKGINKFNKTVISTPNIMDFKFPYFSNNSDNGGVPISFRNNWSKDLSNFFRPLKLVSCKLFFSFGYYNKFRAG